MRRVLDTFGVTEYWENFVGNFYAERSVFGDGSQLFRSMMRKLISGATQTAPPPVVVEPGALAFDPDAHIRQKICESFPITFMPNLFVRPSAGSLVAVYMPKQRLCDLGLVGFKDFEPLVAVVREVIENDSFECSWMVSQPVKGPALPDGLRIGYNGRWAVWLAENGEPAPTVTLKLQDIYANDFKLSESTKKMPGPLKRVLKKLLAHAKGDTFEGSDESEEEL